MTPETAGQPVRIKAKKSAKLQFTSTTLLLEAFVILFATFAWYGLQQVSAGVDGVLTAPNPVVWGIGLSFVIVLIVLSRMCAQPGGYVAGSLAQAGVLAFGFVVPMMFGVAAIFIGLWVASLRLGARIDRERAAYDAANPDQAPNV